MKKEKRVRKVFVCSNGKSFETGELAVGNFRNELIKKLLESDSYSKALNPNEKVGMSDGIIDPPYNPEQLALLLTMNSTHFRCCKTKTLDITARGYTLPVSSEFNLGEEDFTESEKIYIKNQRMQVNKFLKKIYKGLGYMSLSEKICLNFESIGYACAEVTRNMEGKILDVIHIPSPTIRIKYEDGVKYYIQEVGTKKIRFIPYGEKFKFSEPTKEYANYFDEVKFYAEQRNVESIKIVNPNAKDDAEMQIVESLSAEDFKNSATELLFIAQSHPATEEYGIPEIIPALSCINGNISIEDYLVQFFENNAIPQYMIMIEGADEIDDEVVAATTKFFKDNIKGKNHSTLIFPVPEGVSVKVEALSNKQTDGSFQQVRLHNRDEILVAHGVTPAQIGVIDVASLGSGTGLSQAETYKERILQPRQRFYEAQFWNKLIGKEGLGLLAVEIHYNSLDIRDEESQRLKNDTYVKNGTMSINEARETLGLESIGEAGNAHIIYGSTVTNVEDIENNKLKEEELETDLTDELRSTFNRIKNEPEEENNEEIDDSETQQ